MSGVFTEEFETLSPVLVEHNEFASGTLETFNVINPGNTVYQLLRIHFSSLNPLTGPSEVLVQTTDGGRNLLVDRVVVTANQDNSFDWDLLSAPFYFATANGTSNLSFFLFVLSGGDVQNGKVTIFYRALHTATSGGRYVTT